MHLKNKLVTRFQNYLVNQPLFQSWNLDERVLVAVSGGADSMLLLHLLKESTNWNLIACHTNHQLRGEESTADEQLVTQVC
ncbi:MAG: tRNA lysidine(34) synthetase TilS, partial [Chitinophagia bacterium]|nr:tRNA lysidine(34) synthetase TilS [Chitinophagia bacterium]